MTNFNNKPKFSFDLGLSFMKSLSPSSKVEVFRTYLNHLDDQQILGSVLKKSVNRCSSLGLITEELYWDFRKIFDTYESEFTVKSARSVTFCDIDDSEVIWPKLKKFINLMGNQSSNSQVTFIHRYILNETHVGVVAEIAIAALNHSAESYILYPDFTVRMNKSIIHYMEEYEKVPEDPNYNRFDTPEQDSEDAEIDYNRKLYTPEQEFGNGY